MASTEPRAPQPPKNEAPDASRARRPARLVSVPHFATEEPIREEHYGADRFDRELPKLAEGPLKGFPRVYALALFLVAHNDSVVDVDTLRRFLAAYQRVDVLSIGELWAVVIMLRIALLENLRRLAVKMDESR